MAQFQFDATKVEPDAGRLGAVPKGWYSVVMKKSDYEASKSGGAYVNAHFQVTEGPYKGSIVYHMFNIKNDNEKTVEIAFKQLSALSHAVNRLQWNDTAQLHDIPLKIRVSVDVQEGFDDKNKIQAFAAYNDPKALADTGKTAPKPSTVPPPMQQFAPPVQQQYAPPPQQQQQFAPPAAQQPWEQPQQQQYAAPVQAAQPPQQQPPAQWTPPFNPDPNNLQAHMPVGTTMHMPQQQQAPQQQAPQQQMQPPPWNAGAPVDPNAYPAGSPSAPPPSQQQYAPPVQQAVAPGATYAAPAASIPAAAPPDLPPWMQQAPQ